MYKTLNGIAIEKRLQDEKYAYQLGMLSKKEIIYVS
jgi:hypothetical protein